MKIAITGATGLIGKKLVNKLLEGGNQIVVLSRSASKAKKIFPEKVEALQWDSQIENSITDLTILENLDSLIHLAGENVMSKRWNEEHKRNIYDSRVLSTKNLFAVVSKLNNKPKSFISASAIGFYDNSITNVADENSPAGNDFLAKVTLAWEEEAKKFSQLNMREIRIRIGIVLDKNGGALAKLLPVFNMFVGGSIANGKQFFPWIHIEDLVNLFVYAIQNDSLVGVYNAVSPGIVTMKEFSKTLGKALSRPTIFTVPAFVLKIIFGEAAYTLINGAKILPVRTLASGFTFKYDKLKPALINLLK